MKFIEPSLEYCQQRVIEAQEMAGRNDSPGTKADWLQIAERWEMMAARAEVIAKARIKLCEN